MLKRLFPLLTFAGVVCLAPLFGASSASAAPRQDCFRAYAPAIQDTFVAAAVEPVGSQGEMVTGLQSNIVHLAFIEFQMPAAVPPNAELCEVQLELYCSQYIGPSGGRSVTDLKFSNAGTKWDEKTLKWSGRVPSRVAPSWETDLGECASGGEFKRVIAKPGEDANEPLLRTVQGWLDGGTDNHGLIIGPTRDQDLSDHRFKFVTRDGQPPPPVGLGPRIVIYYRGGATPTFTPSASPTPSNTPTPTETSTPTETPTPTDTPEPTHTPTITSTPTETPPVTDTPTATATPMLRPAYLPIGLRTFALSAVPAGQRAGQGGIRRLRLPLAGR